MKLGFLLGYSGKQINIPMDLIKHAESLGFDSVWTADAFDKPTNIGKQTDKYAAHMMATASMIK